MLSAGSGVHCIEQALLVRIAGERGEGEVERDEEPSIVIAESSSTPFLRLRECVAEAVAGRRSTELAHPLSLLDAIGGDKHPA